MHVAYSSLILLILPTHNIEATVELADSVPGPPLAHLADLCPLIQMRIKPLHAGKRRHSVVAAHCVHKVLERVEY